MISKLRKLNDKLKNSKEFKDYFQENKDSYLASFFMMFEKDIKDSSWQIDYYNPEKKKIIGFLMDKEIKKGDNEKIFQKKKGKIDELELGKIKVNYEDAIKKVDKLIEEKYHNEDKSKVILILQNFDKKVVWNITYITKSFNVLNVKVDAVNGKIIDDSFESVLQFKK